MARLSVERPIRSIGRFYGRLPAVEQRNARKLARCAHSLPKCVLEDEYYRLKGIVEYATR